MTRIVHLVILLCAFVLSLLVTISLPFLPVFDISRSRFNSTVQLNGTDLQNLRLGIWAPCSYNSSRPRNCSDADFGYAIHLSRKVGNQTDTATLRSVKTRMLAIHPAATSGIFLALLFALAPNVDATLNLWMSVLPTLLTLTAFVIDGVFLAFVRSDLHGLNVAVATKPGPGFWTTLACLILLAGRTFMTWSMLSAGKTP